MDFLNKKSWHPSKFSNVEKVWKVEEEAKAERRKMEELKRKLQEERQIEELRKVQNTGNLRSKPRQERLDWMYEGAALLTQTSGDDFLKGRAATDAQIEQAAKPEAQQAEPASAQDTAGLGLFDNERKVSAEQEAWNRIREDPLLEIKRKEKEAKEVVTKNPAKMQRIKDRLLGMEKERKMAKKLRKLEKKKAKAWLDGNLDGDGGDDSDKARRRRERKEKKRAKKEAKRQKKRSRSRGEEEEEKSEVDGGERKRRRLDDESDDRHAAGERVGHHKAEQLPERERDRERRDGERSRDHDHDREPGRDRERDRGRDRERERERDHRDRHNRDRDGGRDRERDSGRDRRDRDREHDRERDRDGRRRDRETRDDRDREDRKRSRSSPESTAANGDSKPAASASSEHQEYVEKKAREGYGLVTAAGERASATIIAPQKDLVQVQKEAAVQRKREREEREREAKARRQERIQRERELRGLNEEDRRRKLEEMQQDAGHNEERRMRNLKTYSDTKSKEEKDYESRKGDDLTFLNNVQKEAYGVANMEDRLKRNAHFRYRGNLDEGNTFQK